METAGIGCSTRSRDPGPGGREIAARAVTWASWSDSVAARKVVTLIATLLLLEISRERIAAVGNEDVIKQCSIFVGR